MMDDQSWMPPEDTPETHLESTIRVYTDIWNATQEVVVAAQRLCEVTLPTYEDVEILRKSGRKLVKIRNAYRR